MKTLIALLLIATLATGCQQTSKNGYGGQMLWKGHCSEESPQDATFVDYETPEDAFPDL